MKQLYVVWLAFQRRPASMQSYFGYELEFLPSASTRRFVRFLGYLAKGWKTLVLFWREQPQVIWLQLAPTPLLYIAHLYKALFNRQVKIIADCHNSMLRAPWIKFPKTVDLLNGCDVLLVHNDTVKEQAVAVGVNNKNLYVLEDRATLLDCETTQKQTPFPKPWILFPCAFNTDEPIEVVLATARLIPDITLVITGNSARARGRHDLSNLPPNVKLPGFLPKEEFDMLLCSTDAVLGLTIWEGVQLSTANEAVGTGKPLILSNTKLLKQLFYKGAVYVDSLNPESLAQGCKEAILRKNELSQEIIELREDRDRRWLEQAEKVAASLNRMEADISEKKLDSST